MHLQGAARKLFNAARHLVQQHRLARHPRVRTLAGLRGSVEIVTDAWGVPHIYAADLCDLFFAQGYVTARDRFFQIDYIRYAASGRLCELLGQKSLPWQEMSVHFKERSTLDVDVFMRSFKLRRVAEEAWAIHSAESRDMLSAYTAGVNAYLANCGLPLEHRILQSEPEPWSEVDSLVMLKAMAFELNHAWRAILLGGLLCESGLPDDVARGLWPHFPAKGQTIVSGREWRRLCRELAATRKAADAAVGTGNAEGVGSNGCAVAAWKNPRGEALVANDTHLVLGVPCHWHEVRLHGAGLDLQGFALPGVPGIVIGRNPSLSWGVTAGLVQDLDIFVERLHARESDRYLTPEGWQSLFGREETFHIRDESAHKQMLYESRHGPIVEGLATQPESEPGEGKHVFSAAWTGHRPSRELDGLLALWKATGFDGFREALQYIVSPSLALTYADAKGKVGFALAGAIPKRRSGTPVRPLEGWSGEWDWDGVVPANENPYIYEPRCGYVVTANNRIVPTDFPHELGSLFEPPYRAERITERLESLGKEVTPEALADLQLDTHSKWGVQARDALLALVGGVEGLVPEAHSVQREAAELWASWDGDTSAESAGALLGIMVPFNAGRELVRRLAGEDAAFAFLEMGSFVCAPILRLPDMRERLCELGVDPAAVVRWAFERSVERCREQLGEEPASWRWGDVHALELSHKLDASAFGKWLSVGPEPAAGGPDTLNRGDVAPGPGFRMRVGAAARMVASAGNRDRAATVLCGGQSGDRLSRHYDDQLALMLRGELKPARVSREELTAAFREEFWPARHDGHRED